MPIYVMRCPKCGHEEEILMPGVGHVLRACPRCEEKKENNQMEKAPVSFSFQIKSY